MTGNAAPCLLYPSRWDNPRNLRYQRTTLNSPFFPFLHRHIFKELTQTFLVCTSALLALILIGRGVHMRDLFLGLEFSVLDTALLFLYMVPMFLLMVLPISCMISVFLTYSRMSSDRELIALKAGGVSIYQLLAAPALFSCLCLGMTFFISLHGIAWGTNHFRSTILHIANTRAKIVLQPGVFNRDILGLTLFARKVDPVSGRLQQVIFEDSTRDKNTNITVLAPEGEITTDARTGSLVFHLLNGRIYREDRGNISILEFADYAVRLDISSLLSGIKLGEIRPNEMGWQELLRLDKADPSRHGLQRKVEVEIHKRWALPMACLVLGLFALPLACVFEGVKRQFGIVLALVFFLIYYSLFSVGMTMGESGLLPPAVGIWLANATFFLIGGFGLYLAHKERAPSLAGLGRRLAGRLHQFLPAGKESA